MMKKVKEDHVQLGVCYYPEQWPEVMWEDDMRRMKQLNFTYIRIGEFAWSIFEPQEGVFQFELFDKACDLALQYGLKVIMGTPTATPPAWLTHKYPEVLNASKEGISYNHGLRRHYNYSAKIYREKCAIITDELAKHYKNHAAVVGWQIDNELNCETDVFYAQADHVAFREWLRNKYASLDELNDAWGTVFWSQTYTDWEQVYLPRPTLSNSPNPHQALDEKRFISDNAISFAKLQADILRKEAPHQWVTTNGLYGHLDNHKLTNEQLDFFSYDSYPQFSAITPMTDDQPLLDREWSSNLSVVRSISPNFCIMEQQSGPGGWVNRMEMPSPKPGQMRLWTYQSIAHGADMILYFRWRTATFGSEIYWHGINDYHNRPNRRVREVEQISEELQKIGRHIAGTVYHSKVAIIRDYANEWDGELDRWFGPLIARSEAAWFKTLQYNHIPMDYVYIQPKLSMADLLAYEVLIYPHGAVMTAETAALLRQYAEQGGKLIFGARAGYKDQFGKVRMEELPGPVADLCGIIVEDFTLITGTEKPAQLEWADRHLTHGLMNEPNALVADGFNDILQVVSDAVEVIAHYKDKYYAGKPALTRNKVGKGEVYYYGAAFNQAVAALLLPTLLLDSPLSDWCVLPQSVEVAIRSGEKNGETNAMVFLLNYSAESVNLTFKKAVHDQITGRLLDDDIALEPYGVIVIMI
jgi:beta-galactosidase